jgi:NDP-sugar pyrophosphorylase family protein
MKQAIILSGGKGTRLRPFTFKTCKPMLPILGKPHLEYQIDLLKQHGFVDIIISTGYLHQQIVDYFGNGHKFGVNIQYREDGDSPLGTAGAIKNCEDLIESNHVLVLNGDILTDIDLSKLYSDRRNGITIALAKVDDPTSFGVALMNDNNMIYKFVEKPSDKSYGDRINAGIYVLHRSVIEEMPSRTYWMFETDIFNHYAKKGLLKAYVDDFYWLDIGTHERYEEANYHTLQSQIGTT